MDFTTAHSEYIALLEAHLHKLLDDKNYPPTIYEAIGYSLLKPGKRIRPLMLLATTDTIHRKSSTPEPRRKECALHFAAAIEMIHTYSLIHDDLPALDNDDLRRGLPSNHKVYGEAMALLAGDALLNMAYEEMIGACLKFPEIPSLQACAEIASAAGINGMIGGQVMDVFWDGKQDDEQTLRYIHKHKTAALIEASVAAGAIIGGADEEQTNLYREAASNMGLAFQIMDDILDVTGEATTLGKPVGSDAKNNKATYVSLFGMEKTQKRYHKMLDASEEQFKALDAQFLTNFVSNLRHRVK